MLHTRQTPLVVSFVSLSASRSLPASPCLSVSYRAVMVRVVKHVSSEAVSTPSSLDVNVRASVRAAVDLSTIEASSSSSVLPVSG